MEQASFYYSRMTQVKSKKGREEATMIPYLNNSQVSSITRRKLSDNYFTSKWIGHLICSAPRPINLTPSSICFPMAPASYVTAIISVNIALEKWIKFGYQNKSYLYLESLHCDQFMRIYIPSIYKFGNLSQSYWLPENDYVSNLTSEEKKLK